MAAALPWEMVITSLLEQMRPSSGSVTLCGQVCQYKSTKRISKLKLKYDGEATCGAWPGCRGTSCTQSEMGSIKHACKDLIQQAVAHGYVTHEQAQRFANL